MRLGGCQGCESSSTTESSREPGLDAGALRHYIATPLKEGAKKAEGQVQAERGGRSLPKKPRAAQESRHKDAGRWRSHPTDKERSDRQSPMGDGGRTMR